MSGRVDLDALREEAARAAARLRPGHSRRARPTLARRKSGAVVEAVLEQTRACRSTPSRSRRRRPFQSILKEATLAFKQKAYAQRERSSEKAAGFRPATNQPKKQKREKRSRANCATRLSCCRLSAQAAITPWGARDLHKRLPVWRRRPEVVAQEAAHEGPVLVSLHPRQGVPGGPVTPVDHYCLSHSRAGCRPARGDAQAGGSA